MSLQINLGSSRVFWGAVAGIGALIVLLLVLWVIPANSAATTAAGDWAAQLKDLETLKLDAAKIPSSKTLEERRKYRAEFVEPQTEYVRSFFANSTQLMEAPLAGQGPVSPGDFKNAYLLQIEAQRNEMAKTRMFSDPAKAYKSYTWVTTTALPNPSEYRAVLRDYWARYYLYRAFMGKSGGPAVAQVARLEVRDTVSIEHASDFEGVPFLATVTVDPKSVTRLVNTFLAASPTITDRPVFQLTGFKLTPAADATGQLCALQLEGYILLLKKVEKPAAAGKSGGAEKK